MTFAGTEGTKLARRLAAILAADIAGYSALMGADEARTVRDLKGHQAVVLPMITGFGGRIIDTAGDGILAEFGSVLNAVECAIALQKTMAGRNAEVEAGRRMLYRVGINFGDVIFDDTRIYGDGINIAARLESIALAGGICLSEKVHDEVQGKIAFALEDLGPQTLKNIARPVRVYSVNLSNLGGQAAATGRLFTRRGLAITALACGGLLTAGSVVWWAVRNSPQSGLLPATMRASIAVLPLSSLADASNGDYFSDGLTEDIISALGRFRELSVSSRGAVFTYKGRHPPPEEVGRDLKVRYVVEGSIRRSPDRIQVSVNLTDASRGVVLWSGKYEGEPKDIFDVQDQITRRLAGAVAIRVTNLEAAAAKTKAPASLEAYDLVLRGRDRLYRLTRSNNAAARSAFESAIALDPNYSPAYVGLARVNRYSVLQGWTGNPTEVLERAEALARKAVALDEQNAGAHAILGLVLLQFSDHDGALNALNRAIEINGSDAEAYSGSIAVLLGRGSIQQAIAAGEFLMGFQPALPAPDAFHVAMAYVLLDRGANAIAVLEQSLIRTPDEPNTNIMLVAAYAVAGREAEARQQASTVRARFPWFVVNEFGTLLRNVDQREKLRHLLTKAGL